MNVNTTSTDAAMATIFNQSPNDAVGIAVLKKSLDSEKQNVQALLNAIPEPVKTSLPSNLGQNVNTTA